ncbi:MAG: TIGR03085 family metal-binding protein, partial [Acidimicrobiales bacterium]
HGTEPRSLDPGEERVLWARLVPMTRLLRRKLPLGVTLEAPGYGRVEARRGQPHVTLTGPPGELLLFVSGRQRAARVDASGEQDALARLAAARLGL